MSEKEIVYKNVVEIAKVLCEHKLHKGDIAIDGTMGNGNDTAYLCSLVGREGMVYAFDIQEEAVKNTQERLQSANLLEQAKLIHASHEFVDQYVTEAVKLVIFNLGYLPKGDHTVVTQPNTSLLALKKCLKLLKLHGAAIVVLYPGHPSGLEEKHVILDYVKNISQKEYSVSYMQFINQINNPPELICIEKIKE